tara:strand:+ start:253 stop:1206 length:954 start_codon:yes stop_codon:yes gene_type:complete
MKRRRYKIEGQTAYYHLMSRTVNGEALFGAREKEVLRKMIWQVSGFSGVRVLTYAVMKNHFHLLVEVPGDREVSDRELVRRYRLLYPEPTPWQPMRVEVLRRHLKENSWEGRELRRELLARMHDISWLMKTLKQRFSLWMNRSNDRFGTLWAERFKSVLVEGDQWALRTVAAYIDLNAVRAGLVDDPKDYRFCGYAEAVSGGRLAKAGISVFENDLAAYRQSLYGIGSGPANGGKVQMSREDAVRVLEKEKGKLPLSVVLRCRVRYFSDGKVMGSESFVEQHGYPPDRVRPPKPHTMRGADWKGLAVSRGISKNLFG